MWPSNTFADEGKTNAFRRDSATAVARLAPPAIEYVSGFTSASHSVSDSTEWLMMADVIGLLRR